MVVVTIDATDSMTPEDHVSLMSAVGELPATPFKIAKKLCDARRDLTKCDVLGDMAPEAVPPRQTIVRLLHGKSF